MHPLYTLYINFSELQNRQNHPQGILKFFKILNASKKHFVTKFQAFVAPVWQIKIQNIPKYS